MAVAHGDAPARGLHRVEPLPHHDAVPERCVHRVVLGRLARIGKAVGQHPFGHRARPLEQNAAGVVQPAGGEAEPAQRDERVAAPVAEPRIASDHGEPIASLHEIGVGRAPEQIGERRAPATLGVRELETQVAWRLLAEDLALLGRVGGEDQHRITPRQVPAEHTGRGEVLLAVEPAPALLLVEEAPVPVRGVHVLGVGQREHARHAVVRPPGDRGAQALRVEA